MLTAVRDAERAKLICRGACKNVESRRTRMAAPVSFSRWFDSARVTGSLHFGEITVSDGLNKALEAWAPASNRLRIQ